MDKKPMQRKVQVVVRIRPPLNHDAQTCVTVKDNKIHILNHRNKQESLQYEFSSVFDENATQHDVFSTCVEPLLNKSLHGQNVSIFAYGPTGAGKTHTMLGVMSDPGIIPRVIKTLFKMIEEEEKCAKQLPNTWLEHTVTFSYLEIYNEKVQDLLQAGGHDLPIREDANHNIFVAGLTEKTIDCFDAFKSHFEPASSNRTVAATKLNEYSSRSHSILLLKIQRREGTRVLSGKIYLIDLAGSEDNRRTGNKGIRLKESGAINKSLFVLGEVVDAINHNLPRVPYRNSKLTRLLQDSIGGSCRSVMITAIAPERHFYYDTYCTLNFATKSKKIVNVNTTTVQEENPPAKPMAAVKPTKRRSSLIPVVDNKRRRNSTSSSSIPQEPNTISYGDSNKIPIPSPFLRRQRELEATVQEKLQAMERVLVEMQNSTIHSASSSATKLSQLKSSQSTPTLPQSVHQSVTSVVASPDIICPTPEVQTRPKLTDASNLIGLNEIRKAERSKKLKLKKKRSVDLSCSPLFLDSPTPKKTKPTKKWKSTPVKKQTEIVSNMLSGSEQYQRNSGFLQVLNTATVKELQQLQTVGVKRAKAIYDWRTIHGPFDFIDTLKEIPGFTDKYIKNLLRSNLVTCSINTD